MSYCTTWSKNSSTWSEYSQKRILCFHNKYHSKCILDLNYLYFYELCWRFVQWRCVLIEIPVHAISKSWRGGRGTDCMRRSIGEEECSNWREDKALLRRSEKIHPGMHSNMQYLDESSIKGSILWQNRRICVERIATRLVGQWDFGALFEDIQLFSSVQYSCALGGTSYRKAMAGEYSWHAKWHSFRQLCRFKGLLQYNRIQVDRLWKPTQCYHSVGACYLEIENIGTVWPGHGQC